MFYLYRLKSVNKEASALKSITVENSLQPDNKTDHIITAKVFIDCSYEGDLMAKAGVSYMVGREPNSQYNETYNGVQLRDKHQFLDGIDPFVIKGRPESGLLWGISGETLQPAGSGDKKTPVSGGRKKRSGRPNDVGAPENRIESSDAPA